MADENKLPAMALPPFRRPAFKAPQFKAPILANNISNSVQVKQEAPCKDATAAKVFNVLYTKYNPTKKRKNKSYNDGILHVAISNQATLYDSEGKTVVATTLRGYDPTTFGEGSEIVMGNWELEVQDEMPVEKYTSGQAFLPSTSLPPTSLLINSRPLPNPTSTSFGSFKKKFNANLSMFNKPTSTTTTSTKPSSQRQEQQQRPIVNNIPKAIHDPTAPGAIILNPDQWNQASSSSSITPVIIDPFLCRQLRPHQIEGIKFLYKCLAPANGNAGGGGGCILADEMGLGKTLQVITLIWTLIKQGPHRNTPIIRKALVVVPSSLVDNWRQEIKQWLGNERLPAATVSAGPEAAQHCKDFKFSHLKVLILSYETARKHAASLTGCGIDLLVCDEGHRLKASGGSKTIDALTSLGCSRRLLLTGTPIQNNLQEFYALCDFVCPGILGSSSVFQRVYATAISAGREKNASEAVVQLAEERSRELGRLVESMMLRRTADINKQYLPPLSSYVVFCKPSAEQLEALCAQLGAPSIRGMLHTIGTGLGDQVLTVITALKKLCNHPSLLVKASSLEDKEEEIQGEGGDGTTTTTTTTATTITSNNNNNTGGGGFSIDASGKLAVLTHLLTNIVNTQNERVVVVSQSTAALDMINSHVCSPHGWKTVRIDGSIDTSKRQDIVNSFNKYGVGQVFLLSTTAGGVGLNLIGASKLVLVDSSWNPAHDLQAMARIWRPGQQKDCTVYRLVTTGTLEEKVYQRQRQKADIATVTMANQKKQQDKAQGTGRKDITTIINTKSSNSNNNSNKFSKEELRQLFKVKVDTKCETADLLGEQAFPDCLAEVIVSDGGLKDATGRGLVTYLYKEPHFDDDCGGGGDEEEEWRIKMKELGAVIEGDDASCLEIEI
jgi:DNA repair and recombination protein RAD54B